MNIPYLILYYAIDYIYYAILYYVSYTGTQGNSSIRINELKNDIVQLESDKTQLQNKISRMKKDVQVSESYFQDMLKVTHRLICTRIQHVHAYTVCACIYTYDMRL